LGRRPVLRRPRRARRAVPRRGPAARRGRRRRVHRGACGVHAWAGARRHVPARRPRRHPRGAGGGVAGADGRQGHPRRGGPPVPGRRDAGRAGDPRAAGHPLPARRRAVAAGRRDRPAPHPGGPARLQPRPGARGAGAVDPPPHPALPAGPDQGPVRHRPQFGARHPAVPGGAHLGAPGAAGARGRRRRGRGRRRARSRRGRGGRGRRRRVPAPAAERLKERAMDFPFPNRPGVPLDEGYLRIFRERPLVPAVLPGGRPALLVTRHADVRTVLSDDRFSREAWTGGTLFARTPESLALAASDPPTHTRRRRAVQGWFTARRAEADRPRIEALAERLLDGLEKQGPPADLIGGFATPLPYTVICDMLDIPVGDLGLLLPWVSAMMSAGRFPPEEVAAAHEGMRGYFADRLAGRLARPGTDLLSALATASGLSADEIVVFGYGLLVAGGETTSNFLAGCVLELIRGPDLVALRRDRPSLIPSAVEEFLRWVWFAGTGGRPHVAVADVELAGTPLPRGTAVVPLTDAANRDPAAFSGADEFDPQRSPNPHAGFGHGRHMCLGAHHARVELQVAIAALVRRFGDLSLAVGADRLAWRDQMFIRGVWE